MIIDARINKQHFRHQLTVLHVHRRYTIYNKSYHLNVQPFIRVKI